MTTVLGIKADYGRRGIVLFADTQVSEGVGKNPKPGLKIYKPSDYYALAYTGNCIDGDAIRGSFGNHSRRDAERLVDYLEDRYLFHTLGGVDLLIGTRLNELALYYVNSRGNVKRIRRYMAVGSGQRYANKVLRDNVNGDVSLERAIEIGYIAEKAAFHDNGTGGFVNFVVITEQGIDRSGVELTRRIMRIERDAIERAKRKYRAR